MEKEKNRVKKTDGWHRVQITFGNLEVGSGGWLSLGTRKASGGLQELQLINTSTLSGRLKRVRPAALMPPLPTGLGCLASPILFRSYKLRLAPRSSLLCLLRDGTLQYTARY